MAQLTQLEPRKPSNFDAHKPPEKDLIDDCVHCGFCLPACPTYVLWGEEMDSPRGRIYMMKKSSQGEAPLDQRFRLHMDNCLGCMACMTACPSGVQYNKLIEDTRAQVERNIPRATTDSLFRKLLFATFPYVKRLRLACKNYCAPPACSSFCPNDWHKWNRYCPACPPAFCEACPPRFLRHRHRCAGLACSQGACNRSSSST
jgi:ferredoxin